MKKGTLSAYVTNMVNLSLTKAIVTFKWFISIQNYSLKRASDPLF